MNSIHIGDNEVVSGTYGIIIKDKIDKTSVYVTYGNMPRLRKVLKKLYKNINKHIVDDSYE